MFKLPINGSTTRSVPCPAKICEFGQSTCATGYKKWKNVALEIYVCGNVTRDDDYVTPTCLCCLSGCQRDDRGYPGIYITGGYKENGELVWSDGSSMDYFGLNSTNCIGICSEPDCMLVIVSYDCIAACPPGTWYVPPNREVARSYAVCKRRPPCLLA
ncbi:unnamed protein product, partial [Mesorhabditis belari]|uniref:Uncharacterized protein n=1 Tax=Mesorhabditis belari TaxID=2138241 RepID=A0AAF3F430_9BILA